ncbi:MAG: hypothetical protein HZA16_01415 [Nitrospirae bacterium]|nr:hypothetical protein [Nitrospirota bacterium]
MRSKLFFILIIFSLSGCAQIRKAVIVASEIEQYCRKVSGEDAESMSICMRQERSAKDELAGMTIPPLIEKRCRRLSESTGGSYQVMLTCIQQEGMPVRKQGK